MKRIFHFSFILAICAVVTGRFTGPTNQAGLNIIKEFEGFHPYFYNDSIGHNFIGYGHVCRTYSSCETPIFGKYSVPLTTDSAESLLREDLGSPGGSEDCVNHAITYSHLTANQFSALVSFVQNMGCNVFRSSYLRNKINRGHIKAAENEFGRYVYNFAGLRREKLVKRRIAERRLFSTSDRTKRGRKEKVRTVQLALLRPENCEERYVPSPSTHVAYGNAFAIDGLSSNPSGTLIWCVVNSKTKNVK